MKVAGIELASASDLATACLALPLGYFSWLLYGDPTLVDPQVVSGLAVPTAVGIKKLAESSILGARIRHFAARRELQRTLRAASTWSRRNRITRSEPLMRLLEDYRRNPPRQELTSLILQATEDVELQDARKRLLALQDKLEDADSPPRLLGHTVEVEIDRIMHETPPQIAALDHLGQLSPILTAEQIRAELTKVKQNLIDQGPLKLDQSQAAPNPLQLPNSASYE